MFNFISTCSTKRFPRWNVSNTRETTTYLVTQILWFISSFVLRLESYFCVNQLGWNDAKFDAVPALRSINFLFFVFYNTHLYFISFGYSWATNFSGDDLIPKSLICFRQKKSKLSNHIDKFRLCVRVRFYSVSLA